MFRIVFHGSIQHLQVAYHNVDIEEPALGILISIPCNYCLKCSTCFGGLIPYGLDRVRNASVDENVTFDNVLVKWLLLYSLQRIEQEDKEDNTF
ncbi:hypothetical protein KY285_034339 [Solanum tuberosum]|nr:hypothetical protein KY289_034567 [Solanum tuberosum]KAH0649091.1 hypothetical protein KY285_034339 [Solanum tuberosum]